MPKQDISKKIEKTIKEQKDLADLSYKGVTFQEVLNGTKYWEINAKTSSINQSTGIASLEDTFGTFFKDGVPTLNFSAPRALWAMDKKQIDLINPVGYDARYDKATVLDLLSASKNRKSFFNFPKKYNSKGFFFKAENLNWNVSNKELICNQGLIFQKGNIKGQARKLEGDVALEKVKVSGNPKFDFETRPRASITAKEFELNNKLNTITATNGVILTANEIQIETETSTYDINKSVIKLRGGVTATYKNMLANSLHADYDTKNQLITLTRGAKLINNGSVLTGDKILINIKSKTFSVIGQSKIIIPEEELSGESR